MSNTVPKTALQMRTLAKSSGELAPVSPSAETAAPPKTEACDTSEASEPEQKKDSPASGETDSTPAADSITDEKPGESAHTDPPPKAGL